MALYVRIFTDALTDDKLLGCTPDAVVLWLRGLLYAKTHLTDGQIREGALAMLAGGLRPGAKDELVRAGLWIDRQGYLGVDPKKWARYQTTKGQVEEQRERTRERVRAHREKQKAKAGNAVTSASNSEKKTKTQSAERHSAMYNSVTHGAGVTALQGDTKDNLPEQGEDKLAEFAIDTLEKLLQRPLHAARNEVGKVLYWVQDWSARPDVVIHGNPIKARMILRRAVLLKREQGGSTTFSGFFRYIDEIMERCIRDGCYPNEFRAGKQGELRIIEDGPAYNAADRAVEMLLAEEAAKNAQNGVHP